MCGFCKEMEVAWGRDSYQQGYPVYFYYRPGILRLGVCVQCVLSNP